MKKLRMLSLCSGIGGADLAAEWTDGIEVVGQVEIDPFCQIVLSKHWPHVRCLSDIREITRYRHIDSMPYRPDEAIKEIIDHEFGAIDLVAGGIPCQPFSSAGKQRGTDDDRYLWPDMFRIVKAAQCSWVVIENVDDFTYMALDVVQADLESQDYAVQAFVLPACAVGAPHIRERCFVVAYSNRVRESRQEIALTDGQRGTIESASLRQWEDSASMSYVSGIGSGAWRAESENQQRTTNLDSAGSSDVAHTEHRRCQWGSKHEEQSSTALLRGSSATWSESQSRMGRVSDGISARLDGIRWPSGPGQEQQEWEPARTVTGRQPYRNRRLKALGNTIVPAQIFPIFQGIVECERMVGGQEV